MPLTRHRHRLKVLAAVAASYLIGFAPLLLLGWAGLWWAKILLTASLPLAVVASIAGFATIPMATLAVGLTGIAGAALGLMKLANMVDPNHNATGITTRHQLFTQQSPAIQAHPWNGTVNHIVGDVILDGRKVGAWVGKALSKAMNGPSQGPGGFDASRSYSPAGMPAY